MKSYPSLGQGYGLIGWLILSTILATFVVLPFIGDQASFSSMSMFLVYVLSMLFLVLLALRKSQNRLIQVVGNMGQIKIGVFLTLIAMVPAVILVLDPIVTSIPVPDWVAEFLFPDLDKDLPTFLMIVVAAPIMEEVVFRGIVLEGFLRNFHPKKAILHSALIFGAVHLNPWQFIGAALVGLLLGWLYYRTRSLIPCILVHMLNNLLAFGGLYIGNDQLQSIYDFSPSLSISIIAFVLAGSVVYFGVKILEKLLPPAADWANLDTETEDS